MPREAKKKETEVTEENMEMQTEDSSVPEAANATESRPDTDAEPTAPVQAPSPAKATAPARKSAPSSILTLNADSEVETQESREDTIWHELQNAYRTRKILTGILGGIEKMEGGGTIAVIYYKEMRVVIPLAEMMINLIEDAVAPLTS